MEGLLCRLLGHVDSVFGTVYRVYCQITKLSADLFVDNADVAFIFNFDATLPLCPESPFFFKPHSSIWPQQCDNNKSIQRKLPQLIKSQLRPRQDQARPLSYCHSYHQKKRIKKYELSFSSCM